MAAIAALAPAPAAAAPADTDRADIPPTIIILALVNQVVTETTSQLPCTPRLPADQAVQCAFDTTVWGLDRAEDVVRLAQAEYDKAFAAANAAAHDVTTALDEAEQAAVDEVCYQLRIPEDECPEA